MNWRQEGIIEVEKLGKGLVGRVARRSMLISRSSCLIHSQKCSVKVIQIKWRYEMYWLLFSCYYWNSAHLCRKLCHEAEKNYFVQAKLDYMWKNIITLAHIGVLNWGESRTLVSTFWMRFVDTLQPQNDKCPKNIVGLYMDLQAKHA